MSAVPVPNALTIIEAAQASTGLSQVALAKALGVDPSTLRRWLSGALPINPSALRLCLVLAREPDQLLVIQGALDE